MGTGYTRQSAAEIDDGEIIEAVDLENEFDAIQAAFNASLGHAHDGTTGEGPKISLTTSISGILPVANGGIGGIHKLDATTAPTVNEDSNDGYTVGSVWADVTNDVLYVCIDATVGNAIWRRGMPYSTVLVALAALTAAADKLPYFTSGSAAAVTDLTPFARTLLDDANQAAMQTTLGLVPGTHVQAYDSDLTAWAAVNPSSYSTTVQIAAGYQPLATNLTSWAAIDPTSYSATIAATYQPLDSDLTAIAGLSPSNDDFIQRKSGAWTNRTVTQVLSDLAAAGTTFQPLDSDLTAIAALTTTAGGRGLLTLSDPNADRIVFWDDSDGVFTHLTPGTGLTISTTTIALSSGAQASLALADSALQSSDIGVTVQGYDVDTAKLDVADQVITGGARVTSLSDGTKSSGTYTPDPGDRPMIHITNGGAFTLAPGSNTGYYLLDITNNGSAGAITVSGWTRVAGDPFTTTNGHKFRCSCSIGNGGSLLIITALQ